MKDISKELGISITTISFIVNKKAENKISKEVIKKVEDYIEKVGYQPNSSAQSLRTGKSKTIVFMAEDISDPFFSAIAKQMEAIAFDNGYKIIYCSTENRKERAKELLNLFKDRQVDAFIITPPEGFENELKNLIYDQNQVVMVFDRYFDGFKHNYVVLENYNGAQEAVKSLYDSGKRDIAYIGIKSNLSPLSQRLEGYKDAIGEYNLQEYSLLIQFDNIKTEQGRNEIESFLEKNPKIDGILFATNNLAISGLRVIKNKGLQIPKDLGIISFDDRDIFELFTPPISVIAQPVPELAKQLIKGTLKLLKTKTGKEGLFYQKVLKGELIIRKSQ